MCVQVVTELNARVDLYDNSFCAKLPCTCDHFVFIMYFEFNIGYTAYMCAFFCMSCLHNMNNPCLNHL